MVLHRERDNERQPLSCILPHLYLGAETDVTQEIMSARGISYVLSVSRCSPQPTFVPKSQYLRIPIDDSLRDDLLPWIPQALRFIDDAMSLGCSVLVHCAAGISRSPALAVAYIMYHLGMDLDHAYRFVKERRPSISPNFNFLGQLQLFQSTLPSMHPSALQTQEHADQAPDSFQPLSGRDSTESGYPESQLGKYQQTAQDIIVSRKDHSRDLTANTQQETSHATLDHEQTALREEDTVFHKEQTQAASPEFTLSLSNKLKSLTLSLQPLEADRLLEVRQNPQKPTTLKIPSSSVTLNEKRKRLSLALTPANAAFQSQPKDTPEGDRCSKDLLIGDTGSAKFCHKGEAEMPNRARKSQKQSKEEKEKTRRTSNSRSSNPHRSSVQIAPHVDTRKSKDGPSSVQRDTDGKQRTTKRQQKLSEFSRSKSENTNLAPTPCISHGSQQKRALSTALDVTDGLNGGTDLISPFSLTVNKLLDWGERMLLGVLLGPRIKVGQPALSYSTQAEGRLAE